MPDRDLLRCSIVSHLNHNAPADKKEKPPPRAKNTLSAPDSREKQFERSEAPLKYFYINTATGEKSGEVLAQAKLV